MRYYTLKNRWLHIGLVAIAALGIAACNGDDEETPDAGPDAADDVSVNDTDDVNGDDADVPDPAEVRVVHASPDAPTVDVYVVGPQNQVITDLAYGEASVYLEVEPGTYEFEIRAAGAESSSEPVYIAAPVELGEGTRATAIAAGLLDGDGDAAFRVLALGEDFDVPEAGHAMVRVVHAGADAPAVSVDIGDDGDPEISDLGRYADTGATGIQVPADETLALGIWAGSPLEQVTAFTIPELPEGAEVFVIATGELAKQPREEAGFALLAIGGDGELGFIRQNPRVYALHASPDAPAVDIYAADTLVFEDLAFGELSAPVQVAPGTYEVAFRATGSASGSQPAAEATTPELMAGEQYLAVAAGFLLRDGDPEPFQLLLVVDDLDLDVDDAVTSRILHASPDAPAVDFGTVSGAGDIDAVVAANLTFGQVSDSTELSVGEFGIGVAATGAQSPVAEFRLHFDAGDRAFIVASGALTPTQTEEDFRLIRVLTSEELWTAESLLPLD